MTLELSSNEKVILKQFVTSRSYISTSTSKTISWDINSLYDKVKYKLDFDGSNDNFKFLISYLVQKNYLKRLDKDHIAITKLGVLTYDKSSQSERHKDGQLFMGVIILAITQLINLLLRFFY